MGRYLEERHDWLRVVYWPHVCAAELAKLVPLHNPDLYPEAPMPQFIWFIQLSPLPSDESHSVPTEKLNLEKEGIVVYLPNPITQGFYRPERPEVESVALPAGYSFRVQYPLKRGDLRGRKVVRTVRLPDNLDILSMAESSEGALV